VIGIGEGDEFTFVFSSQPFPLLQALSQDFACFCFFLFLKILAAAASSSSSF